MITKLQHLSPQPYSSNAEHSPRTPRNRIQRKPENNRVRLHQDKHKRQKSRGDQYKGFYSPNRNQLSPNLIISSKLIQTNKEQFKTLKNQRSLTNLSKNDFSKSRVEHVQYKNKQNSISMSSGRSSSGRKANRMQLQLKALTYQNVRLKSQNKTLMDNNKSLKLQVDQLNQTLKSNPSSINNPKPGALAQTYEKIKKLKETIELQQIQLKQHQQQLLSLYTLHQQKHHLQSWIKALQSINQQQKQEIFQKDKMNQYLEIQLRTIKKQRIVVQTNKRLQQQLLNMQVDNQRLRKIVLQLQNRLKNSMLFDLTPQQSQTSQSFLLD